MEIKPVVLLTLMVALVVMTMVTGCIEEEQAPPTPTPAPTIMAPMELTSPDFADGAMIPQKSTCEGDDVNPALVIENVPAETLSIALIVEDIDAPQGIFAHWVVYNIPVMSRINEGSIPGKPGVNDFGSNEYRGPCPPSGTHRYVFTIYALDTEELFLGEMATRDALETVMQGHVLASAELIGRYEKGR